MRRHLRLVVPLALVALATGAGGATGPSSIAWQGWSDAVFEQAKREKKLVLLDLGAVWCHWCHVMDRETYGHARVAALVASHYVPVRVDQDARPDLSRRYEDYGWPATVVFDAEGREIVKLRGYVPARRMIAVLEEIIADPSPVVYRDRILEDADAADPGAASSLSPAVREELQRRYLATHDARLGGLVQPHKYLDWNTVEYGLLRAGQGQIKPRSMARQTLDGALNLIDPVWGGAYQYSTHGDWKHVHFEKIMQVQAESLRLYALAYLEFGDARYLRAAEAIHRYVKVFLASPDGVFYASQDADLVKGEHSAAYFALDDAGRRRLGIPAVDTRVYARENGWMITALATLGAATGKPAHVHEARVAAGWIIANRAMPGGGFRHDAEETGVGPYLDDTLAMGRAFLALHAATGERVWLDRAEAAARFIDQHFRNDGDRPGYVSTVRRGVLRPRPNVEENIALARFTNLLAHYAGEAQYRAIAEQAMRYLAIDDVALYRNTEPGILLAEAELRRAPTHLTVVGRKGDPDARALHRKALRVAGVYRRIEWWDRSEGPLRNPDVRYPELVRAAAYLCADGRCSLPAHTSEDLGRLADRTRRAGSKN